MLTEGAWVLAAIHKKIAGFQRDEVYIGTAEEREKNEMSDDDNKLHLGAGHLVKLPNFTDGAPHALQVLVAQDKAVQRHLNEIAQRVGNKMEDV